MWRTRRGRFSEIIRRYACNNIEYFALKQANNSCFLSFLRRPDGVTVHTIFHGKIPEGTVATWIIVLAIISGVLILLLITMALHKVRLHF
jgi:hypothetical protein